MRGKIRIILGVSLIAITIVSLSYVISIGQKRAEQRTETEEIKSLRDELASSQKQINDLKEDKNNLENNLAKEMQAKSNSINFINSKDNLDLKTKYLSCMESKKAVSTVPASAQTASLSLLKRRFTEANNYLSQELRGDKLRYTAFVPNPADTNQVILELREIYVVEIYPECKTTETASLKYIYNIAKRTLVQDKVN